MEYQFNIWHPIPFKIFKISVTLNKTTKKTKKVEDKKRHNILTVD